MTEGLGAAPAPRGTPTGVGAPARRPRGPRGPRGATALGVVGELLLTLGVLLGLFVVWQLWWTDVVADGQQAQVVEDLGWAVTGPADAAPEAAGPDGTAPGTAPTAPPADDPPVPLEPSHATTFATLQVPRWGTDYVRPISQGTSRADVLDVLGLGHYEGTAMPGAVGNFAVAGHRTTYGKPLHRVEELEIGDPLVVQTQDAWYVYRVTSTQVVLPHQVEVIAPVPGEPEAQPTERVMTLTTCHPLYSARERFVVHATLDRWLPAAAGVPAELTAGPTGSPTGTGGA